MVNVMSALSSSATVLFMFWSLTMFAKKLAKKGTSLLDNGHIVAIMGTGFVGALAYAFTDSFWFSAVEGEVYAMSSFFTAIVFWAILKWEVEVDVFNNVDPGQKKRKSKSLDNLYCLYDWPFHWGSLVEFTCYSCNCFCYLL